MDIGGIGSSGFDYQALLEMQKAMAIEASKAAASSSIGGIETGSTASSSKNSSSNDSRQQSTPQSVSQVRNKEQELTDSAANFKANSHRFSIDQAVRNTDLGASFNNSLNAVEANVKANKAFEAANVADISTGMNAASTVGSTNTLIASVFGSSVAATTGKVSTATAAASAITSKYNTQAQVPVLNSFKPVDKYI